MSIPPPIIEPIQPPLPSSRSRNGLLIGMSIACAVLLLATMALGVSTVWFASRAPIASPTISPSPGSSETPKTTVQVVQGHEVTVHSDLAFGEFALSNVVDSRYTILYAPISWDDDSDAISAYFDVTAYDKAGRIIDRNPASHYLLPGQKGLFRGIFSEDISDAVSIKVEQTMQEIAAPSLTGGITMESVAGNDEGYVEGTFSTTLSTMPEHAEVYLVGLVDGELFGVCSDLPDIPAAGGTFTAGCYLEGVSKSDKPVDIEKFPKDAKFDAFLELEIPWD